MTRPLILSSLSGPPTSARGMPSNAMLGVELGEREWQAPSTMQTTSKKALFAATTIRESSVMRYPSPNLRQTRAMAGSERDTRSTLLLTSNPLCSRSALCLCHEFEYAHRSVGGDFTRAWRSLAPVNGFAQISGFQLLFVPPSALSRVS